MKFVGRAPLPAGSMRGWEPFRVNPFRMNPAYGFLGLVRLKANTPISRLQHPFSHHLDGDGAVAQKLVMKFLQIEGFTLKLLEIIP